jgi:hypothetical protein
MIRSEPSATASTKTRSKVRLSGKLDKHLAMYAAAATAAGVGLLSTPGAQAEIVYTPAHVKMDKVNGFYPIDFDMNGVIDVGIWLPASCTSSECAAAMFGYPNSQVGNGVVLAKSQQFVQALRGGSNINRHRKFLVADRTMGAFETFRHGTSSHTSAWVGPWANGGSGVKGHYLGVKFAIDGQFHYGWVRIGFIVTGKGQFYGLLTGYAYETTPNKAIRAGQTMDANGIGRTAPVAVITPTIEPPTLGHLATGSLGLSRWRRQSSTGNSQ